jgi:hypothetical protein
MKNGKFSKWNKRITAWLLLIVGFYMGIMKFPIEYIMIFLGSGLAAIGLSVLQAVRGNKTDDHPPPDDEPPPGGN